MSGNKESWPEMTGKTGEEAKEAILSERPDLTVHIVPDMSPVTMDYRPERVRIFVNTDGKVVGDPRCG